MSNYRGYGARTQVPAPRSRGQIEQQLVRAKATHIAFMNAPDRAVVAFRLADRMIRFSIPMPPENQSQAHRQRWRALLMCIKAKLESVRTGIEQFDEAFLAHVVMPDGKTMSEHALPQIAASYKTGKMPPLLGFDTHHG